MGWWPLCATDEIFMRDSQLEPWPSRQSWSLCLSKFQFWWAFYTSIIEGTLNWLRIFIICSHIRLSDIVYYSTNMFPPWLAPMVAINPLFDCNYICWGFGQKVVQGIFKVWEPVCDVVHHPPWTQHPKDSHRDLGTSQITRDLKEAAYPLHIHSNNLFSWVISIGTVEKAVEHVCHKRGVSIDCWGIVRRTLSNASVVGPWAAIEDSLQLVPKVYALEVNNES